MCGRFALTAGRQQVEAFFSVAVGADLPSVSISRRPDSCLPCLWATHHDDTGNLPPFDAVLVIWSFVPAWTKEPDKWPLTFNIRSEIIDSKRSLRNALHYRRVIVSASGFYE